MHSIELAFQKIEYDKFVLRNYKAIPEDIEQELQNNLKKFKYRTDIRENYLRLSLLKKELPISNEHSFYVKKFGVRGVRKIYASNGEAIYCIPVFCFPMGSWLSHYTNCYLIIGNEITLIDTGSMTSETSFKEGLRVVRGFYGENIHIENINNIIITHGHIDHFGGLSFLHPKSKAKIMVHEKDVDAIMDVETRYLKVHQTIKIFLHQAGIPEEMREMMIKMHKGFKNILKSYPVSKTLKDGDLIINNYEIIHTPGHCPGSICIKNGDVMFLGDHILMGITPHQFPKLYMHGMGLIHYIPSLLKICARVQNVRLGLPAHNEKISKIKERALEIIDSHHERLGNLIALLEKPKNLYDISSQYFSEIEGKDLEGYDKMLAIEEIAAHLEYLVETLNCVRIINPESSNQKSIPLYQAV